MGDILRQRAILCQIPLLKMPCSLVDKVSHFRQSLHSAELLSVKPQQYPQAADGVSIGRIDA
jgi:hypothetical protein